MIGLRRLINEVTELLRQAGVEEPRLEIPKHPSYGELSSTAPFELARKLKRPPIQIAEETVRKMDFSAARLVASAEAVAPGYINFRVRWGLFAESVVGEVLEERENYGFKPSGEGRTVLVEHTSVNPNKALHIGHARNVCLGDTLARLFTKLGYRVVVANYIDDSGNQMADIHLAFRKLGYSEQPPDGERFDEYCGRVYAEVNKRVESEPELAAEKRRIIAELEDTSSETFRYNRRLVSRVLREQLSTCWRLGARYDILNRESDIIAFDIWRETFERLKKSGIIYLAEDGPKRGCWLISLAGHPTLSREGDEVLVKSDGVTTYVARDIAYAAWKLGLLERDFTYSVWGENPDGTRILITDPDGDERFTLGSTWLSVNVIDARQKRPQEVVKYGVKALGAGEGRYIHFAYAVVTLSKRDAERLGVEAGGRFTHMSGREGIYINADTVLDVIKHKAAEEAAKRHPDWGRERLEETGEKIAVAALRYDLLKSDAEKMIVFDTEEAASLEGDTGPYLQYSYARATRILEKSGWAEHSVKPPSDELHEAEKELVRKLAQMPLVMEEVEKLLLIKRLAVYAHELSSTFNDFYEKCPVLGAGEETTRFRLGLVKAFRQVMENVCWVLGIPLLEEM